MQGNKKHADGQSDSSSIGSLADETDREVCSLTDRAFKSLCLDELEPSYTETDPVASPRIQHPFSSKYFQGPRNHAIKKNMVSSKLLPQTEEHSTFQQLLNDTQGEKRAVPNSTPNIRRKLGLPVPNLHHYKHTSKVSSLIKTFDQVENIEAPATVTQPVKNHLPKFPLICGANVALWGGKTILNIPKELSEFSGPCQSVADAHGRPDMHIRHHKPMDLLYQGPPHFYSVPAVTSSKAQSSISTFSKKIAKNRTGKAKDLAGKTSFLHSENSAFKTWNSHHKKLDGTGGASEFMPAGENLACLEETTHFEESYVPDRQPSPLETADSVVLEQDFLPDAFPQNPLSQISLSPVSLCQSPSFPPTKARGNLAPPLLPPSSGLAMSGDRSPTPPPLPPKLPFSCVQGPPVVAPPVSGSKGPVLLPHMPQAPLPPEADSHAAGLYVPHVTLHPEKTKGLKHDPELGKVFPPPWRRQKAVIGGMETAADVGSEGAAMKKSMPGNPPDLTSLVDVTSTDSHDASSDASNPSFNITQLLTPLMPPKQDKELPEGPLFTVTPPLSEAEAAPETEERTTQRSQNNYKSKAPSLLFNLKDIRKRVKSTYSPAPLHRVLEEKKVKETDSLKGRVAGLLEGRSSKSADEESQKPPGKMGSSTQEKEPLLGHYQRLRSPSPKADREGYLKGNRLQQENSMDLQDSEMVSIAELHAEDRSPNQCPRSSQSERDMDLQNAGLQDPQNQRSAQSHRAEVGPEESPSLFFTAEENVNDSETRARPGSGNERKDKRSPSSSEQSFVSIADPPSHEEESFSLMQLFQKACLQESQRNRSRGSAAEKPSSKAEEKAGRPEEEEASRDLSISSCDLIADGKSKVEKVEQSKEEERLQERREGEGRGGGGQSPGLVAEGKLEELPAPTSSGSFKPNLFKIKDNTFKSPPVIKTVKLPLFRSLSCDGAIAGSYGESERQACGPLRTTPVIQETDWPLSRNRRQRRTWRAPAATGKEAGDLGFSPAQAGYQRAEKGRLAAEELGSFYEEQPVGDRMAVTPGIVQNKNKGHKQQLTRDKEKVRTRRLRPSSASQLHLEGDLAQSEIWSPMREKANYYKNNLLSKRRSGSCMKKVITREARSPAASETRAFSPAFSDLFGDTPCPVSQPGSTAPNPRSSCPMQSAFTSRLPDTTATCSTAEAEKTAASSLLHQGTHSNADPAAAETSEPTQTNQPSGYTDGSPVTSERAQLMREMVKTAAKPPAVPPKTEKALRRAKKLANRRKKVEAQQKKPLAESPLPCEGVVPLPPPPQSPLLPTHLCSPVTPSEPHQVTLSPVSSSPTPSSPATQRKLLQDPDSGEYFIVDLPTQFKTLYDPESGRYIQVSLPSSRRNLCQTPSSEVLAPPYVLYPNALPLRVASVPTLASPSQHSEPASLVQGALSKPAPDWQQDGCCVESVNGQPYLESAVSEDHTQEADRLQFNYDGDVGLLDKTDIISLGALEDFAVEGIS